MVNGAIHFEGNYLYQNKKYTSTNASVGLVLRSSTNGSASTIMATQIKGYYDTGISIVGGSGHQILGTIATRPPEFIYALGTAIYREKTAIYCAQASECNFNGNRLTNYANGVEYYKISVPSDPQTIFQNNKFLDNQFGLVMADFESPLSTSTTLNNINNPIKVKIECNLFDNNNVGIIGMGLIDDQGSSVLSAGNRFQGIYANDLNIDWGILWKYIGNNPIYNYYKSSYPGFDDPKSISATPVWIDGSLHSISNISTNPNIQEKTCSQVIIRSINSNSLTKDSNKIQIYPNPAFNEVVILNGKDAIGKFKLLDMTGRIVFNGLIISSKTIVKLEGCKTGTYIFHFANGQSRKLLVIQH